MPPPEAPCLDPAPEAAPGLVGEVLQVEDIHGPLQTDVEVGDLALGHGHERDAGEAQPLVQRRDILLIAGEAVECLSDYDVEPALARPL